MLILGSTSGAVGQEGGSLLRDAHQTARQPWGQRNHIVSGNHAQACIHHGVSHVTGVEMALNSEVAELARISSPTAHTHITR